MTISRLANILFVGLYNGLVEMYTPIPNHEQALGVWSKLRNESWHSSVSSMICNDDVTQNTANLYVGLSNGAIAGYAFNSRGVLVRSFELHDTSWKSGATQMTISRLANALFVGLYNGSVEMYNQYLIMSRH